MPRHMRGGHFFALYVLSWKVLGLFTGPRGPSVVELNSSPPNTRRSKLYLGMARIVFLGRHTSVLCSPCIHWYLLLQHPCLYLSGPDIGHSIEMDVLWA